MVHKKGDAHSPINYYKAFEDKVNFMLQMLYLHVSRLDDIPVSGYNYKKNKPFQHDYHLSCPVLGAISFLYLDARSLSK